MFCHLRRYVLPPATFCEIQEGRDLQTGHSSAPCSQTGPGNYTSVAVANSERKRISFSK